MLAWPYWLKQNIGDTVSIPIHFFLNWSQNCKIQTAGFNLKNVTEIGDVVCYTDPNQEP